MGLIAAALAIAHLTALPPKPVKVACVGDSITFGARLRQPGKIETYPAQLQGLLGSNAEVGNFGTSGSTLLNSGDRPYQKQADFPKALAFQPDVVVIMLGTNDSKPQNWKFKDQFVSDYEDLIAKFRALPTKPTIYLCYPPIVFAGGNWGISEAAVEEQMTMIDDLAKKQNLPVIDNHRPFQGKDALFADHVHPNAEGATILARTVYEGLTRKSAPSHP